MSTLKQNLKENVKALEDETNMNTKSIYPTAWKCPLGNLKTHDPRGLFSQPLDLGGGDLNSNSKNRGLVSRAKEILEEIAARPSLMVGADQPSGEGSFADQADQTD